MIPVAVTPIRVFLEIVRIVQSALVRAVNDYYQEFNYVYRRHGENFDEKDDCPDQDQVCDSHTSAAAVEASVARIIQTMAPAGINPRTQPTQPHHSQITRPTLRSSDNQEWPPDNQVWANLLLPA